MMEFLSFVLFVFGVLQIILFFKLWGMTNDVRLLRKHFIDENQVNINSDAVNSDVQYQNGNTIYCKSLKEEGVIKGYDGEKYTVEFSDGGSAEIYPCDITPITLKSTISVGDRVIYTPMGAKCVVVAYDKLSDKYKLKADNGTTFNAEKEDIEKN